MADTITKYGKVSRDGGPDIRPKTSKLKQTFVVTQNISVPEFTKESVLKTLPKTTKKHVTDELLEFLNQEMSDTDSEAFRENIISYSDVLASPGVSVWNYVRAVKFCSYILQGDNRLTAWTRTFPAKYAKLLNDGKTKDLITNHAVAYSSGKTVTTILDKAMVPAHIMNMRIFQEAVNSQAMLMRTANSETVRMKAADSLMNILKAPEAKKVEIDVNMHNQEGADALAELRDAASKLASDQRVAIAHKKKTALEVAEESFFKDGAIEADYEEVT